MQFAPAGETIGAAHQVRTVTITGGKQLPAGDYRFIDMYCTNPACDCRKTMIEVFHNDRLVSIINFGWESRDFYRKWMGCPSGENITPPMDGPTIDIASPDRVSPQGMLALFNALLDEKWISTFKRHYAAVKKALAEQGKTGEAEQAAVPDRRKRRRPS